MLEDQRLLLFVGDVGGRGAKAAAVMGQLRTGMRAYALQQVPATTLMRNLDQLLGDLGEGRFATAVCVVVDPVAGQVEVISAGHPPPLVIDPNGAVGFLDCEPNTPLGVMDAPVYTSRSASFSVGSTLLLYTDGLVEARDVPLDQGMERLVAVLGAAALDGVEQICDLVVEQMVGGGTGDDVAVLAARLLP